MMKLRMQYREKRLGESNEVHKNTQTTAWIEEQH